MLRQSKAVSGYVISLTTAPMKFAHVKVERKDGGLRTVSKSCAGLDWARGEKREMGRRTEREREKTCSGKWVRETAKTGWSLQL